MKKRAFLFFLTALSSHAQSIAVASPVNGAVITGNVQLQATITAAAATEHVDWYVNGDLYASSHLFNGPCGSWENCPGPGFSARYVTTDGPDTTNGKVYAVAKDVFGHTLATSATNTFTIRNLGAVIQINVASQPWAGDVLSPFLVNGSAGNGYMGAQPNCYIDGMPNLGVENGYIFLTGGNVLAHTARYPNGIHDVHCLLAGSASGLVATPNFPASAVNVGANTITLSTHPFLTGQSFVYTTSGTPIAGLTPGNTYYAAVIGPNTLKVASTPANAATCAAGGSNCITLGGAGTGTHTLTYTFLDPYYIASPQFTMPMSIYRTPVDFENGNAAMELRMPEEIVLYQDLGPTIYTSAPFVANCDSSTTSIATNAATYSNGGANSVFTVNPSGVVTAVGPGFADLTTTYAGLPPVVSHVSVFATTQFKHLSKSGQTLTTYTPGQSVWANSVFQVDHNYDALTPAMCPEWQWSGDLSTEESSGAYQAMQASQTNYTNAITNNWTPTWAAIRADATNCNHGLFWNFQAVNIMSNVLAQYKNLGWSNTPGQTRLDGDHKVVSDIVADGRTRMIYFGDEITNEWDGDPSPNALLTNGGQFSQIVVTGCPSTPCAGSAVVSYTSQVYTNADGSWMKLINCTTANLCGPYLIQLPTVASTTALGVVTSFTITTHNVLNGTYNASTDPAMKLIYWMYTGTGGGERYIVPGGQPSESIQQGWNAGASLDHITVTGSSDPRTATVTWNACCGLDTAALATGRVVWGHSAATHTALNNVFQITKVDSNTVTFQTYGLAAGTYNSTTDPAFFFTVDGTTDENVIRNVKGSILNVPGVPAISWPILGVLFIGGAQPNYLPIANNWENNLAVATASHKFSYNGPFQTYGDHSSPFEAITDKKTTAIVSRGNWMYPSIDLVIIIPIAYSHYATNPCSVVYKPGTDLAGFINLNPAAVTTQMAWVVAKSATVGKRAYHAGQDQSTPATSDLCSKPAGAGFDQGPDPFTYWMPFWNAMALDNSLDNRLTKYIFQPMITSPGYGPYFFTGARGGANGKILMIGSLSSMPRTQLVDFTPYRSGGLIRRYRLTARGLSVQSLSSAATSDTPTFAGGEVIYYVFQPSGALSETNTVQLTPPASFPPGTSKMAIKTGYYHSLNDVDAIDCTSGCAPEMDLNASDGWFQRIYLDGSNVVKTVGDQQVMRHH